MLAGLVPLYVILLNGLMLGALLGVTLHYSMAGPLLVFISAHGLLELTLILVSAAAGLAVGRALVAADDRPRAVAVRRAATESLAVLLGCLPWFVILALVEVFVSPFAGGARRRQADLGPGAGRGVPRPGPAPHPTGGRAMIEPPVSNATTRGPMPFTLLLDEALRRTRAHFRAIFPSIGLPVAVLTTIVAAVQTVNVQRVFQSEGQRPSATMMMMWSPAIILAAVVLGILAGLAYLAGQVAVLDAQAGRPVDMKRAWTFAVRPAVWGTALLSGLLIIVSFVLCILPVFYVAPLLSFVVPVMVEEGRFGTGALSRSAEPARFNPSRQLLEHPIVKILLLMLVTTLLSYLAGVVVALPFQIPMFIDLFRKAMAGQEDVVGAMARWMWLQVPAQFLSALARMAIYIYSAFGIALLFADVRWRREGIDLRSEIDALFPAPVAPGRPLRESFGPDPRGEDRAADRALLDRVLASSGVERTPVPPQSSYFGELIRAAREAVNDALKRGTEMLHLPRPVMIAGAFLAAAVALLLILRTLWPRWRHLRPRRPAAAVGESAVVTPTAAAAPLTPPAGGPASAPAGRRDDGRGPGGGLVVAGPLAGRQPGRAALDQPGPGGPDRAGAQRADLTRLIRRLDALIYGPLRPLAAEVRGLVARLEEALG